MTRREFPTATDVPNVKRVTSSWIDKGKPRGVKASEPSSRKGVDPRWRKMRTRKGKKAHCKNAILVSCHTLHHSEKNKTKHVPVPTRTHGHHEWYRNR